MQCLHDTMQDNDSASPISDSKVDRNTRTKAPTDLCGDSMCKPSSKEEPDTTYKAQPSSSFSSSIKLPQPRSLQRVRLGTAPRSKEKALPNPENKRNIVQSLNNTTPLLLTIGRVTLSSSPSLSARPPPDTPETRNTFCQAILKAAYPASSTRGRAEHHNGAKSDTNTNCRQMALRTEDTSEKWHIVHKIDVSEVEASKDDSTPQDKPPDEYLTNVTLDF